MRKTTPPLRRAVCIRRATRVERARRVRHRGARAANRWPWSYSRCQTAQCCSFPRRVAAPGLSVSSHVPSLSRPPASPRGFDTSGRRDSSNSVPPMRGGWSADRRTLSFGRACDARPPCPGATGTPLGAPPWRFSAGTHAFVSGSGTPEPQRLPTPRHQAWRSGSGPPCVAVRAAARDATPPLRLQVRLRRRPYINLDL